MQLSIAFVGMYSASWASNSTKEPAGIVSGKGVFVAIINEPPEEKLRSIKCQADLQYQNKEEAFTPYTEKLILYFSKNKASKDLRAGDLVVFEASPTVIDRSGNPYEFDYRNYLAKQGIFRSAYIDSLSWKRLANDQLPFLWQLTYHLRDRLLNLFSKLGLKDDELSVAMALTIGDKALLDTDIKRAYSASGTMHLLAVSGMHVALIYWVLGVLIRFPSRKIGMAIGQAIILVSMLWFYALITGLPASILRAAVMCTFIVVSKLCNRQSSVFNSLAASAFFLLLYNPFYLIDAGFQLSYLAVLSIVIFYQPIFNWLEVKSWLGYQIWSITAVTLAAQVLTTPVSFYYFHQFPNLFLLSNLVMIPLSTGIIYVSMLLISLSWWTLGVGWIGKGINAMVWALNQFVVYLEGIPHSVIKGIYFTGVEVVLIYLLVITMAVFLLRKAKGAFVSFLIVILIWFSLQCWNDWTMRQRHLWIVYNEKGNTVIHFISGTQSVWLIDKYTPKVAGFIETASNAMKCANYQLFFIDSVQQSSLGKGRFLSKDLWIRGNYIQFRNSTILLTRDEYWEEGYLATDYQIIRGGLKRIHLQHPFSKSYSNVIFDSSVPFYSYSAMKSHLPLTTKHCWVSGEGAHLILAK